MQVSSFIASFVVLVVAIDGQSMYHSLLPQQAPQGAPPTQNHFRNMLISTANRVPGSWRNTVSRSNTPSPPIARPQYENQPSPSMTPSTRTTSNYVHTPSNYFQAPTSNYVNTPMGTPMNAQMGTPMNTPMNAPMNFGRMGQNQPPMGAIQPPAEAMAAMQPPAAAMDPAMESSSMLRIVTPQMKTMVNKFATTLGHKAYYQAHGCVDPTTSLLGQNAKMAKFSMMMGCNTITAEKTCQLTQVSTASAQENKMMLMMKMFMPQQYHSMKVMLEKCLTPSTMMNGLKTMMSGGNNNMANTKTHTGPVFTPPRGAALASPMEKEVNCKGVSQMLMMGGGGMAEGLMGPDSMDRISTMRKRFLPMTCQENIIMGMLPYRLCCPGYVRPPTMQEAMMMKAQKGM